MQDGGQALVERLEQQMTERESDMGSENFNEDSARVSFAFSQRDQLIAKQSPDKNKK